jgi:hypothetical protein
VPRSGLAAHAKDGETLAGIRAGFQAEIHNKGWQIIDTGRVKETMALNTIA